VENPDVGMGFSMNVYKAVNMAAYTAMRAAAMNIGVTVPGSILSAKSSSKKMHRCCSRKSSKAKIGGRTPLCFQAMPIVTNPRNASLKLRAAVLKSSTNTGIR
jgi:hypothetical protein